MKRLSQIPLIISLLFALTLSTVNSQEPQFYIKSVDVMKTTQDAVCNPPTLELIQTQVKYAKELGATHVAISTPYDNPECGSSESLTLAYVTAIRAQGLNVWFRQKPLAFEGFYNTQKTLDSLAFLAQIKNYILSHPEQYKPGDIMTPVPEPQQAGVQGLNCSENCLFNSITEFNLWLISASAVSMHAFEQIGLKDQITIGLHGFDGFIAWGDRNPDWNGSVNDLIPELEHNLIGIDHYFPLDADPQEEFAKIRQALGEEANICLSEWGSINADSPKRIRQVLQAALNNNITCLNWWHLGPSDQPEALLKYNNNEIVPTENYYVLQEFFNR